MNVPLPRVTAGAAGVDGADANTIAGVDSGDAALGADRVGGHDVAGVRVTEHEAGHGNRRCEQ